MSDVNAIYTLRKSFSIIALTGRMSAGCSFVAERLSQDLETFKGNCGKEYRDHSSITFEPEDFSTNLFKRKYSIVQNYVNVNWKPYKVIDYRKVLFLILLNEITKEENPKEAFVKVICSLFQRGSDGIDDDLTGDFELNPITLKSLCEDGKFNSVISTLLQLGELQNVKGESDLKILYSVFFGIEFNDFFKSSLGYLNSVNLYLRIFLFHKLGNTIREFGSCIKVQSEFSKTENVYYVAKVINRLIKAYKYQPGNSENCQIVVDSLRNSLEIMFFKERFSAFYMVSIHNEDGAEERIKKKIEHPDSEGKTLEKIIDLDNIEYDSSSFSRGDFNAPEVQNCIQKSEIHIRFIDSLDEKAKSKKEFYTLTEQLMKIQALIQQPGIITPTGIERCMQVAFNSKFNSGCISRQVGAAVTDSGLSIKSVGWNDVPQNTIACLFRSTEEVIDGMEDIAYSEFEGKNSNFKYIPNVIKGVTGSGEILSVTTNSEFVNKNFVQNLQIITGNKADAVKKDGKNCPYCFKSSHNKFEGEKNQVHTRSLHAEENAMLQISKHGGQKLKDGFLFTTASPCELCAKKAFQLGISKVFFIDKYPGISKEHILNNGVGKPILIEFTGVIGSAFNKLYEPLMAYKDELGLYGK